MPIDYSIARWVNVVPTRQWARQDAALAGTAVDVPELILSSKPLAEVHRLDLALFVVFEEAALRVSGALTRRAPTLDALHFSAQQTLDEARHHELFRKRLDQARSAAGLAEAEALDALLIPPLRTFLERCYEVADSGAFIEALSLMNLLLEGMAYPLYSYEERYWQRVDPYLAQLVRSAFDDETRHIAFGAATVRSLLADDPVARERVARMCREARALLAEVFRYYVRAFVGIFDAVARRMPQIFAGAELAPGRLIATTPYEEQVAMIHTSIETEHDKLMTRAGLQ
jgi:hypothetical protein